jgi:hypothetical protein
MRMIIFSSKDDQQILPVFEFILQYSKYVVYLFNYMTFEQHWKQQSCYRRDNHQNTLPERGL